MTEEKQESPQGTMQERDLFLGLVQSFQAAAMQQMGKVMNPFTQKIERDMAHAKLSIEMLEMLRARTNGNLTGQEARFLNHVLTELRLNYVQEADKDKHEASKPPSAESPAEAPTEPSVEPPAEPAP